ncbi:efflux RND transporter permease subunit [Stieleria varia]|uniref:MMPL family protein n=1 Tax=Stieleria varia TaxID=2528005 RepID=A0A5C6AX20_9BACT|nr:MMPL family transporter [Stieleria varia]TWU04555.1 MMPL family protein [Stieleria varia]
MQSLAKILISARWPLAAMGLLVLMVCYPISQRLTMDRRVSSLFSQTDPTLVDYQSFKSAFGGNEIILVVYRDDELATTEGMDRSRIFSQQIRQLPGVAAVLSPAILNDAVKLLNPISLFKADSSVPALIRDDDPVADGLDEIFSGYTHSADHTRAAVVVMLQSFDEATTESHHAVADRLNALTETWQQNHPVSEISLVGEPVLIHDAHTLIQRDGAQLALWTVSLLSLVVLISLWDLRFVALTGLCIVWSVVATRAAMVGLGISLSLIASILTAIVTVIAVASILHLGVRFRRMRWRGHTISESVDRSLTGLLKPILWTCLTDAAGFAALLASGILPVRQFGVMIAVSALAVLLSIALFAPALMSIQGFGFRETSHRGRTRVARRLRRICFFVANRFVAHRVGVMLGSACFALLAIVLVARSETETSFLKNFRSSSRIVIDYSRVETDLGGAGVWDVVLDAPAELTPEYIDQVLALEQALREIDVDGATISKAISAADAVEVLGRSRALSLLPVPVRLAGMRDRLPAFINALISEPDLDGRRQFRIMLRSKEALPAEQKRMLIQRVNETVLQHVARWNDSAQSTESGSYVTGYYVIMARLVEQLIRDQWRCFAASIVLIWILMLMATRSVRYATAALLPNLLPVFVVLAFTASLGEKTNMGAAMIAAVSVGLSIDGSVHFLAGYRRRRVHGHSPETSASHAAAEIGVPVLLATIALVVGFSVLSTSEFVPTATFGTLVAATMATGTLINLTLLPATVSWWDQGDGTS